LLENNADPNLVDNEGNSCLHAAVSHGSIKVVDLLLKESCINALAINNLQRNALHLTANVPGILGAELFQTIIEAYPNYPLEQSDVYGNTVFLLAFINGNEALCRLALKYNVCLGTSNHQGETIFRINTPTKQLLFGLLSKFKFGMVNYLT
jgi:ankyrin repeat protein